MDQALQRLGRYLITEEIATGGMATVYKAKLIGIAGFEKDVAIKKILPAWSHQKEFVDMLIDEAKILVQLQHANIVQIFELAKYKDSYFIAMEFVDGINLRRLIHILNENKQRLPLGLACHIIKEVSAGLMFAHNKRNNGGELLNIVHRDISPQNVLLSFEGDVKITDFGIASVRGKSTETAFGTLKGKYAYMSPEQANTTRIDHRSDIYSLALVFFELITGKKYYDGETDWLILQKVKESKIIFDQDVPEHLRPILELALQKDVNKRYQNAGDFKRDVDFFAKEQDLHAGATDLKNFLSASLDRKISVNRDERPTEIHTSTERETKILETIAEQTTLVTQGVPSTELTSLPKPKPLSSKYKYVGLSTAMAFTLLVLFVIANGLRPTSQTRGRLKLIDHDVPLAHADFHTSRLTFHRLAATIAEEFYTETAADDTGTERHKFLPAQSFGTLTLTARPWGNAFVEEIGSFSTPNSVKLSAGAHTIVLSYPPANKRVVKRVDISQNQTVNCRATFGKKSDIVMCE